MVRFRGFRRLWPVLAFIGLAGCGFHLRGSVPSLTSGLYIEWQTVQDGSFVKDFKSALTLAGGRLLTSPTQAGGVVHIYRLLQQRRSLSLSRFGRATEFDLIYRLVYDIRTPKGEVILPRQEIELHRDFFNEQLQPLALSEEETLIRTEMRKELAEALLRRVGYVLEHPSDRKS